MKTADEDEGEELMQSKTADSTNSTKNRSGSSGRKGVSTSSSNTATGSGNGGGERKISGSSKKTGPRPFSAEVLNVTAVD